MLATRRFNLLVTVALTLTACGVPAGDGQTSEAAPPPELDLSALEGLEVFEPQLALEGDGTLLLVWRQKAEEGFNLYVAHQAAEGGLAEPVRINDEPGTVYGYPHDEMRPAVASGRDGVLGVVWADERAQIRAAVGRDHGRSWDASTRLDQEGTPAYRSFTAADFDEEGALHAVWIDSRLAPRAGAEEPADLFYARLAAGEVTEINLTVDQEPTICGCCRPDLNSLPDGTVRATFRNSTADGYRDIFRITGSADAGFSAPARVGPPLWKISGCPMSGPLDLGHQVLWADGSSGRKVVMTASGDGSTNEPLFAEPSTSDWTPTFAARRVLGAPEEAPMVLVAGQPGSRLLEWSGGSWATLAEDVPRWGTSAAIVDDHLILVGAVSGEIKWETRLAGTD